MHAHHTAAPRTLAEYENFRKKTLSESEHTDTINTQMSFHYESSFTSSYPLRSLGCKWQLSH